MTPYLLSIGGQQEEEYGVVHHVQVEHYHRKVCYGVNVQLSVAAKIA